MAVLRLPEVMRVTGMSRSSVYVSLHKGEFPQPVKLGDRAVGWHEAEVNAWLESRPRARPEVRKIA